MNLQSETEAVRCAHGSSRRAAAVGIVVTSKFLKIARQVVVALIVLMLLALPWIVRQQLSGVARQTSRARATY
jgi:uncharacterized membrane protein YjgN (DUF898 family)